MCNSNQTQIDSDKLIAINMLLYNILAGLIMSSTTMDQIYDKYKRCQNIKNEK